MTVQDMIDIMTDFVREHGNQPVIMWGDYCYVLPKCIELSSILLDELGEHFMERGAKNRIASDSVAMLTPGW